MMKIQMFKTARAQSLAVLSLGALDFEFVSDCPMSPRRLAALGFEIRISNF
jgi:hypothetical protein